MTISRILLVPILSIHVATSAWGQAGVTQPSATTGGTSPQSAITTNNPHVIIESAPIHIMGQPPDAEFEDEFKLPPQASPELVARRNQIDQTNAKINEIAERIDQIMASQTFDAPLQEVQRLKELQQVYRVELQRLMDAQQSFNDQLDTDTDHQFSNLPQSPMTPADFKEME